MTEQWPLLGRAGHGAEGAGSRSPYHAMTPTDVLNEFGVDPAKGLTRHLARQLRRTYGANALRVQRREASWKIFVRQFESLIVWLLLAATILSVVFDQVTEAAAIAVVVAINALIGFVTEWKAVRSMEALRHLGRVATRVRRNGRVRRVPAQALVPGDIVLFEGGDIITADLRVIEAAALNSDESALTGESMPVAKDIEPVAADTPLAERSSLLFKGAAITRGSGVGVVVATGMETELGRISALIEEVEDVSTPLERRLDRLSAQLLWVTLAAAVIIGLIGIIDGRPLILMVETAVALAVAAVPEGLPMVNTLVLARGMWRMARRNALIESLPAVETLGATTVICTDKTGTLTENRMAVACLVDTEGRVDFSSSDDGHAYFSADGAPVADDRTKRLVELLEVGVLCNNAVLRAGHAGQELRRNGVGDPMEVALLSAGALAGIDAADLLRRFPEQREAPFDTVTNMMATFHAVNGSFLIAVKGAPEAVLAHATGVASPGGIGPMDADVRERWHEHVARLAKEGLRVIAVAQRRAEDVGDEPYRNLEFLGLIGLRDPPRADAAEAIRRCHEAGMRVVMVTGDHGLTARSIAAELGLAGRDMHWESGQILERLSGLTDEERRAVREVPVFARVTPEQKLRLVEFYQGSDEIVAMTGDGVNDAPALKKADIGIAMGVQGTQVAREAADMILRDDRFETIVAAVEQGRVIFSNIRMFVVYLLSCNLSELLVVGIATAVGLPLPILPLQILFLNLVTDVFPAFSLGACEAGRDIMRRRPRPPGEGILMRPQWVGIIFHGLMITAATLGAFIGSRMVGLAETETVTVSFLTLAFAQLWHVFNMRGAGSRPFRNEVTANPYVWGSLILCAVLLLGAVYWPLPASVLNVVPPGSAGWSIVLAASAVPVLIGHAVWVVRYRYARAA